MFKLIKNRLNSIFKIFKHDTKYSGMNLLEKIGLVKEEILKSNKKVRYLLTTELDDIACNLFANLPVNNSNRVIEFKGK